MTTMAEVLERTLLAQQGHKAMLRALVATHPDLKALRGRLDVEILQLEADTLPTTFPDDAREATRTAIAKWKETIDEIARRDGRG